MIKEELKKEKLPRHVAIIMDGNGRWAKSRYFKRIKGHQEGMASVRAVIKAARKIGLPCLTLYAFSSENWQRPQTEVKALMSLLKKYINKELDELHGNQIKVNVIGDIEKLPPDVVRALRHALETTKNNTGMLLNIALSYSGREEILMAVRKIADASALGRLNPQEITASVFEGFLYTSGMPQPDLLIRTSGEFRISNFLLWQLAYTEIYITDVLWPDFREDDFYKALLEYQKRKRRFGLTDEQLKDA